MPVRLVVGSLGPGHASVGDGSGDPPAWCFRMRPDGAMPTCTYENGHWTRSYDDGTGGPGGFVLLLLLGVLLAVAVTAWRVSTARRLARSAGIDEGTATTMALATDDGLAATYLAASLRAPAKEAPASGSTVRASTAERLQELASLRDQGLITDAEHDARRAAIIDQV